MPGTQGPVFHPSTAEEDRDRGREGGRREGRGKKREEGTKGGRGGRGRKGEGKVSIQPKMGGTLACFPACDKYSDKGNLSTQFLNLQKRWQWQCVGRGGGYRDRAGAAHCSHSERSQDTHECWGSTLLCFTQSRIPVMPTGLDPHLS